MAILEAILAATLNLKHMYIYTSHTPRTFLIYHVKHIAQIIGQKRVILPQLQAQIRDLCILEAILDAIVVVVVVDSSAMLIGAPCWSTGL